MTRISDALAEASVENLQGATVPLGRAWQDQTAVLVFLRHYG